MDEVEENIKVVVRVRDLIAREKEQPKAFGVMDATDIFQKSTNKSWTFDRVYNPVEDNKSVYLDTASPMIESTISGFNATIFAYGQTSSGKTHTMYGTESDPGVIRMAVEQLFYAMEETPNRRFLMMVSFIEIYNETVVDLLTDPKSRQSGGLKIRETDTGDVYVDNLSEKSVSSEEDIYHFMKEGEKSRKVGATNMNERSSRSHTIFRIKIESTNRMENDDTMSMEEEDEEGEQVVVSQLNLVDLAGSERAAQTGAGGQRLKEGCNINQSLMTLGQVIQKLSSGSSAHIPYRDSKLTRILQNSLGGNAKTAIICTVTPAAMSEDQTISTLRFASEAKKIQNKAKVNEVLDNQAQISRLKKEMEDLRAQLAQQQKVNSQDMLESIKEQLEQERREKEAQLKLNEELRSKIITSSQPAPPRKSVLIPQDKSKRNRRETWCGPALRKAMRHSMAPATFLKPLPKMDLDISVDDNHIKEKMLEATVDNDESWLKVDSPSPVAKKKRKTVNFVHSPKFLSPRKSFSQSIIDLNSTDDGGTPKAVIRDKYKRVSLALERERMERLEAESELQELQEFTRLEDESGVNQERKSSIGNDSVFAHEDQTRFLEKSFKDAESLNLELKKQIHEKNIESNSLHSKLQELQLSFEKVSSNEKLLASKVQELEPLASEVKHLKEKSDLLEMNKQDFDMQMELALAKKEGIIEDLRKCIESSYEEIALLENGNKEDIRTRYNKLEQLQNQVSDLQSSLKDKEKFATEAANVKEELEHLKEGFHQVTTELESMSRNKEALEQKLKDLKIDEPEENLKELEATKNLLLEKESIIGNLELSNASLLENIDELSRNYEEASQKNTDLLVSSNEVSTLNKDLKEEINQLKAEVQSISKEKENFEIEDSNLKVELEELKSCLNGSNEEIERLKEEIKSLSSEKVEFEEVNNELKKQIETLNGSQKEFEDNLKAEIEMKVQEEADKYLEEIKALSIKKIEFEELTLKMKEEIGTLNENKKDLEQKLKEFYENDEVESLKAELLFANEEKRKLEEQLESGMDDKKTMLEKLSATLTCIEESFVGVPDGECSITEETVSGGNVTISGTGITIDTVMEIKNQLLALQEELIQLKKIDPEELKAKEAAIIELKKQNEELNSRLSSIKSAEDSSPQDQNSVSKIHEEYEDKMEELKKKHQAEIAIITSKMKEDMKTNLEALEEKLKEEYKADNLTATAESSEELPTAEVSGSIFTDCDISMDETVTNIGGNFGLPVTNLVGDNLGAELAMADSAADLNSQLEEVQDQKKHLEAKIKELQGELDDARSHSTVKEALEKDKMILEAKIQELELLTQSSSALSIQLEQDKQVLESKMNELQQEVHVSRSFSTDNETLRNDKNVLEAKIEELEQLIQTSSTRSIQLEEEKQDLESKIQELQQGVEASRLLCIENEALLNDKNGLESKIKKLLEEVDASKTHLATKEALENANNVLEARIKEAELLAQSSSAQSLQLEEEKHVLESKVKELQQEVDNSRSFSIEKEVLLNEKHVLEARIEEFEQLQQTSSTLNVQLEEEKQVLESKFKELLQEVDVLRSHITAKEALENDKNNLEARIEELEQLTQTSAALRTQLEEEKQVLDSKIHELQQEVEALRKLPTEIEGLENEKNILEAKIKEFEQLTQSSTAMSTQLEEEKQDLISRMSKLEEENLRLEKVLSCKSKEFNDHCQNDEEKMSLLQKEFELRQNQVFELQSSLKEKENFEKEVAFIKEELEEELAQKRLLESRIQELQQEMDVLKSNYKEEIKCFSSEKIKFEEVKNQFEREIEGLIANKKEIEEEVVKETELKVELEKLLSSNKEEVVKYLEEIRYLSSKNVEIEELRLKLKEDIKILKDDFEKKEADRILKISSLEEEIGDLKKFLTEAEGQRDMVDDECNKLEEQLEATKQKLAEMTQSQTHLTQNQSPGSHLQSTMLPGQNTVLNDVSMECTYIPAQHEPPVSNSSLINENDHLKTQLQALNQELVVLEELKAKVAKHQAFEEKLYQDNLSLKATLQSLQEQKPSFQEQEMAMLRKEMEEQMVKLKEELGKKNIELASIQVDVERGELQFKKKCDILQADLDYEKSHNVRLTQEIRRIQSQAAMDTTSFGLGSKSASQQSRASSQASSTSSTAASTNTSMMTTSATSDSPVWSSGSGALKEIRLYDAELKVKSLEKENSRLKEHEEFYINKAREWKNRALKYERTLQDKGIPVPTRDKGKNQVVENKENADQDQSRSGANTSTQAKFVESSRDSHQDSTATENIKLVLTQRPEPRRTEEDFRLPEGSRKKAGEENCKQQ